MSNKKAEPRIVLMPTDDQVKIAFEAYAMAVGKVAHAWNYLNEKLGILFSTILHTDPQISSAVWYSTDSDRTKQKMLKDAIAAVPAARWPKHCPSAQDDLLWLLNRCIELGDARNNAIHAPCILVTDASGTAMKAAPPIFSGHDRARRLDGKEILVEFDWCERWAEELSLFTVTACAALRPSSNSWPDRPSKPHRKRKDELNPLLPVR